jgi:hypothetical protein
MENGCFSKIFASFDMIAFILGGNYSEDSLFRQEISLLLKLRPFPAFKKGVTKCLHNHVA